MDYGVPGKKIECILQNVGGHFLCLLHAIYVKYMLHAHINQIYLHNMITIRVLVQQFSTHFKKICSANLLTFFWENTD